MEDSQNNMIVEAYLQAVRKAMAEARMEINEEEASFDKLPEFFQELKEVNRGTVAEIETVAATSRWPSSALDPVHALGHTAPRSWLSMGPTGPRRLTESCLWQQPWTGRAGSSPSPSVLPSLSAIDPGTSSSDISPTP